ncbi:MAG: tRNA (adenosine(37)-N6)-threonylcarbamoyltransferase complex ATPase subunit type 1 TsaE [Thermoanaerobaculales bacterium]|jgi:tRNA threonylcarbamoyl adenosine modification protein YjeE|nr:tRNA (adenosine(37)-N6)-threonylcarbamoyltransferase complex ATPase subunit type 1 TsaE [Thermoanaerobaculales bacterium]
MSPPETTEIVICPSADRTEALGAELAARLEPGHVVLLEGDLAAGKTTLVRGLVRALGGDGADVSSPTFVLLQSYPCARGGIEVVHHVDLYRLGERIADLREIGVEEILSDPAAVVAVEWPKDALATWIPADARLWRVVITTAADDSRRIEVIAPS